MSKCICGTVDKWHTFKCAYRTGHNEPTDGLIASKDCTDDSCTIGDCAERNK